MQDPPPLITLPANRVASTSHRKHLPLVKHAPHVLRKVIYVQNFPKRRQRPPQRHVQRAASSQIPTSFKNYLQQRNLARQQLLSTDNQIPVIDLEEIDEQPTLQSTPCASPQTQCQVVTIEDSPSEPSEKSPEVFRDAQIVSSSQDHFTKKVGHFEVTVLRSKNRQTPPLFPHYDSAPS